MNANDKISSLEFKCEKPEEGLRAEEESDGLT